ncbi:MAG: glycosyltransferase [Planctomycetaceae bacterium]|nr:glycosyltransferase [Planctomycetaceae bacterium]
MKLFITSHSSRTGGGISVAKNLLKSFATVAPEHQYFITIPPELGYEELCGKYSSCLKYYSYKTAGKISRWYWETFELPQLIKQFQPDMIFNMANRGLATSHFPQATLIQDSHLVYPESLYGNVSFKERCSFRYHIKHLKKSLKSTNLVFCQTPVMEKRFKHIFGNFIKTAICPNQFSFFVNTNNIVEYPKSLIAHKDKFKLFVLTRYYVHKNLEILIELFRKYQKQLNNVLVVLTIDEEHHPQAKKMLNDIKKYGLQQNIISVGSIPQNELGNYYKNTNALLLPTLLESFSGTYLEAMNFETPILTSDMDFAHHICGDAAIYFDPFDVNSIYNAIIKLKESPELARRMIETGNKQKELFSTSWDDIAKNVIRELESIAR